MRLVPILQAEKLPKSVACFNSVKRRHRETARIRECEALFIQHLENLADGKDEGPGMELRLLEAILGFPQKRLAFGLLADKEYALALRTIEVVSPYRSVREEAGIKLEKALAKIAHEVF